MAQVSRISVDNAKIKMAIQAGIPLTITSYTLPHEMEEYISDILTVFLTELGQQHMKESLSYCLRELVNNAKKANTKRVYFEEKGLNLGDASDYEKGMKTFKLDTIDNIKYYLNEQKNKGLYIKVILQTKNNKIKIEIRNKAELTVFEYKRIHDKITRAQEYTSVEQGIAQILDDSEGAGLGLVIMILVLRKIGLTEENFQVLSEKGETITRLILPFSEKTKNDISCVTREFVNLITDLPELPENITAINNLISNPNSKMSDIAAKISSDISLTAELLKIVNSAAFALSNPCRSISDSVKFVGLKGIRNLLFSIGTKKNLMVDSSEEKKKMWDHCCKVANYSHNLARNFCKGSQDRSCIEDSYVCGLLHDMGKIVFENAHPDILKKVNDICEYRGVSPMLFERMISGANHGEVGALVAEKWNFPDVIINVIRYHHNPENAPAPYQKILSVVYVADLMVHYAEGLVEYNQISQTELKILGITSQAQFIAISQKLEEAFNKE